MFQRAAKLMVLVTVLSTLVCANSVQAFDRSVTIRRGQTLSYGLSPGDTLTVYYNPDGRVATFSVVDPYGWWAINAANRTPVVTAMSAYSMRLPWHPPLVAWQQIGNYSISPWATNVPMTITSGAQYMFVIKNYKQGDVVYVSVK